MHTVIIIIITYNNYYRYNEVTVVFITAWLHVANSHKILVVLRNQHDGLNGTLADKSTGSSF